MTIKVYINSRTSDERKIVDAEVIKENNKTIWVKIPNMVKYDTHFLRQGDVIIQRKKARDIVHEDRIQYANNKSETSIRLYSPKVIVARNS